jgi:hypothetical protein
MADYLPGPDSNYAAWVENFRTYAAANLAALGLTAPDLAPVTAGETAFDSALAAHITAKNAAMAAKQAKDFARRDLTADIRPLVRRIQANPNVTDAQRAALGITIPDVNPTPVGPPATRPVTSITLGQRLQHTLNFVDELTPTRRAKPAGAIGVEVWAKVGTTPPTGEGDLQFMRIDSSTPAVLNFTATDGNKTAYYWTRWVTATGERGPWSEQVAATIAA